MTQKGTLFLIPGTLGPTEPTAVLPGRSLEILLRLNEFVVEEERTARRYLRKAGVKGDLNMIRLHVYNEHSKPEDLEDVIHSLLSGQDVGLLSEAGVPCVADPGHELVLQAHFHHIRVVPLPGPSSIILALMASGFNGQNFAFRGYLPVKMKDRIQQILLLERTAYQLDQTQIFIETPYRNISLFNELINTCSDNTMLCIACDITLDTEWIRSQRIAAWRKAVPDIHKRPAVFLLFK